MLVDITVELNDMRQQDGVCPAMGDMEHRAQLMGHAVVQAQGRSIERQARQAGGDMHLPPGVGIVIICLGAQQELAADFDSLLGEGAGKFIVLDADIGLQRVGHDVHPRIRRDRGWDTLDQDLIQDRFVRDQVVGRQGVFDVLLRVGNDGKAGDLAAGAAGRRDGDEAGGECRIHIPGKFPHRLG